MPYRLRGRARLLPSRRGAADGPSPHAQRDERLALAPSIRPATAEDRAAVGRLYLQLKHHHHDLAPEARRYQVPDDEWLASIHASMADPGTEFFVAEEDDSVVAFMRLRVVDRAWGRSCEIDTVVVAEEARGRSIGRELMGYAERVGAERGVTGMRVNVLADNQRGIDFYSDLGYSTVALRLGKEIGS